MKTPKNIGSFLFLQHNLYLSLHALTRYPHYKVVAPIGARLDVVCFLVLLMFA